MRVDEGKLRAYLDGELSTPERDAVERSLAGLPEIQETLVQLRHAREQVNQGLDILVSPAAPPSATTAFRRLQAQMEPAPSPAGTPAKSASSTVWESPSLLAEIKNGVKEILYHWRQAVSKKLIIAAVAALVIVISLIPWTVWPEPGRQLGEQTQREISTEIANTPVTKTKGSEKSIIIVVLQPIKQGEPFLFGAIGHTKWPTDQLPPDPLLTEMETVGKVAAVDLTPGQVLVRGMLEDDTLEGTFSYVPVSAVFSDEIELVGYSFLKKTKAPQDATDILLQWRTLKEVTNDHYKVFIDLIDAKGALVGHSERYLTSGDVSPRYWALGEVYGSSLQLSTENLSAGSYDLEIGMYDSSTLKQLKVQSETFSSTRDDRVLLRKIELEAVDFEVKEVRQLLPCENQNRNRLLIKVQDANGQGINNVPVTIQRGFSHWGFVSESSVGIKTETLDNNPGRVEFAMEPEAYYSVKIEGTTSQVVSELSSPIDTVDNKACGTNGPGEPPYDVSYMIIFQQTTEADPASSISVP